MYCFNGGALGVVSQEPFKSKSPQSRADLLAERRRLFDQLSAGSNDPRRAGISHADFIKLSDDGRIRVPESAGILSASTAGAVSVEDVFNVNACRTVICVKTEELLAELANSGDLQNLSDEALEERAELRCLELEGIKAAFERFPDTMGNAVALSVRRLRHRDYWRLRSSMPAGSELSKESSRDPIDHFARVGTCVDDRRTDPTSGTRNGSSSRVAAERPDVGPCPSQTRAPKVPTKADTEAFADRYAASLAKNLSQLSRKAAKK